MNNLMVKRIIIALTILYVLSPLDLAPGPLDDIRVRKEEFNAMKIRYADIVQSA